MLRLPREQQFPTLQQAVGGLAPPTSLPREYRVGVALKQQENALTPQGSAVPRPPAVGVLAMHTALPWDHRVVVFLKQQKNSKTPWGAAFPNSPGGSGCVGHAHSTPWEQRVYIALKQQEHALTPQGAAVPRLPAGSGWASTTHSTPRGAQSRYSPETTRTCLDSPRSSSSTPSRWQWV